MKFPLRVKMGELYQLDRANKDKITSLLVECEKEAVLSHPDRIISYSVIFTIAFDMALETPKDTHKLKKKEIDGISDLFHQP